MTTYRARNTLTGQTFLPRATMTHAMQDYIMQPVLSLWTVDLLQTPDQSKSFESVFPEATESPRGTQGMSEEERSEMISDMLEEEYRANLQAAFVSQSAEFEPPL